MQIQTQYWLIWCSKQNIAAYFFSPPGASRMTTFEAIAAMAYLIGLIVVALNFVYIRIRLLELHLSMNSRLDELLATAKKLSLAEGFRAGQESRDLIKQVGDKVSHDHGRE
jgi:amino acid transporter